MALSPFFYDLYRPSRLLDQQFGLALTPDELTLPTYSTMAGSYYRPWRSQTEDTGSTIDCDKDKFRVCLDVQQFRSNEITVKTTAKQIIIEGKHEERQDEHGSISRQFIRKYCLPEDCESEDVTSSLTADGVLIVEAKKRVSRTLKDRERVVPIDKIAAVCQKSGACKKGTAQNIKESMQNKMMEEAKEVSATNSKQGVDFKSKDTLSKMKDESMCAMNAKQKCDSLMTSQKSDSFKDDFKKGSAAKEERCSLLNADGSLKFSSEISGEALRAAKASSVQERVDFSSTSMTSETVQSKESSFSSTEMSCGFRSGDAKGDFISDIIKAELKAAENL